MKRTDCLILLIIISTIAFGQSQQGIVKTRGRLSANGTLIPGTRLSGATVSIQNTNPLVSGNKGTFSFSVSSATYSITSVKKQGYQLCDNDIIGKGHNYSKEPLVLAMETPENTTADRLAAEKKIRRTLQRQLQEKEDEIELLKEQQKITEEEYQKQLQTLYEKQEKNDNLIAEMADRYSTIDFDEMNDFQRNVAFHIQNGDLTIADSLLNTKGSMAERSAELDRMDAAIKADAEDISKRQKAHKKSIELRTKTLEDFAADCYSRYEICKMQHKNDSAVYWLELRASKDTLNGNWLIDCSNFYLNYIADFNKAEEYMQRVVKMVENDDVYDAWSRINSYYYLADVFLKSSRYEEAIDILSKAITLCKENAIEDPDIIISLSNCYSCIGETEKALSISREAYKMYTDNNNKNHNTLLRICCELGKNLLVNGELEESKHYYDSALNLAEDSKEVHQPQQIVTYYEIADFYKTTDKYNEAEVYYQKALDICKLIYDERHPMLSSIYNELGIMYYKQSKMDMALDCLFKAYEISKDKREIDSYATICHNISTIYSEMGKVDKSEEYGMEAYNIRLKVFGENSPIMINSYIYMGSKALETNDYDKAEYYINKAIAIQKNESGDMHPSLISLYSIMGGLYMQRGMMDKGLEWFQKQLALTEHYFGQNHSKTADAYANIGGIYLYLRDYESALSYIEKGKSIHISVFGEKNADVAGDYNGLGQTYLAMNKYQEAIQNFQKAIDIRKEIFGEKSIKLKSLYGFMKQTYQELKDEKNVELYDSLINDLKE